MPASATWPCGSTETCRDMLAREFETRPSTDMERLRSIIASGTGSSSTAAPTAQRPHATGADVPSRSATPEGTPSLAVLPFANLSGDREQDYFADGLTNDIINALCRFRNLHVIARNSSFRYRGGDVDVRQAAANWACSTSSRAACADRTAASASPPS